MDSRLRIAVADDDPVTLDFLKDVLTRLGHEVIIKADTGARLAEKCRSTAVDLVITDIKMPDMDGLDAAGAINKQREVPVPVILISGYHDDSLLSRPGAETVMAYLVKPLKAEELKTTIAVALLRFRNFLDLSREAASLRQALEDRKLIERAKGSIMKRLAVNEDRAFQALRKMASTSNRRLVDVARDILTAEDVFHRLEES
jgi:response regulator NasT